MTTTTETTPRITLYYREGSSDKVYQAAIEPSGTGFVVHFAYGRRGSTLTTGSKTPTPVSFDQALKVYDKLVREKTSKGYTPGEDGTPYQQTEREDRATGILPQLLNPIDEDAAQALLGDPAWWAQEKFDGRRMLIRRSGDTVIGINRQGLAVALPRPIESRAIKLGSQQWIMDGECVGDGYYAFDLLESACIDLRPQPYAQRLGTLRGIVGDGNTVVRVVETAVATTAKRTMLARLREQRREGVVFKRSDAAYTPGRPASGGDQLKLKFTATASCIVAGTNGGKRSIKLDLLKDGHRVGVGSVTIPPRQPIPIPGQVVEVRYLYAYEGGALYQPVFLAIRDDIDVVACTVGQLKLKAVDADNEE